MAKLDFSSLKTADLRSVAPVDESAIPRTQQTSETESPVSASVPETPVQSAPAAPAVAVSAPAAPVAKPAVPTVHAAKKISLTGLKSGGSSAVSAAAPAPAAQQEVSAPAAPVPVAHHAPAAKKISLGTKPLISLGTKKEEPVPAPVVEETPTAPVAEEVPAETVAEEERPLVEGVDIIEAAKVIGTEAEEKANEILTESLKDPEVAKKEAEEKAVAAVVIPESEKEFFPNLEMDDDFFKDPLFEGIVPPKPDKKPEVRQPIEMKKGEPEAASAVAEEAPTAEAAVETPSETVAETVVEVSVETVEEAVAEVSEPTVETPSEPVAEEVPATEAATPEAYVETVAKDLSAERKGGLAKLFGERKVLVRAMAGFFALAVVGVGAFSFVSPSIKTSGPESVPPGTGSEIQNPIPKYVPEGETKILGEGVRVFTGRRPNGHKRKNVVPVANSGAVSATGSQLPAASGSMVGSGAQMTETLTGNVVQSTDSGTSAQLPASSGTGSPQGVPMPPAPPSDPEAQPAQAPTAVPQPPVPQTK